MKNAAAVAANGGAVEETVTRRRIVPAEIANNQQMPEFWAYLETLKPESWSPYRHKLYIYRYQRDDASGPMDPIEKNESGILLLPETGEQVTMDNREDTEFALAQKFGGGLFRLILKKEAGQRVTETRVHVDAPRKAIRPIKSDATGPTVTTVGDNSVESVAHHAITTIANQERTAVDVGIKALLSAGEVVQRFAQPAAAAAPAPASETDQMLKLLMVRLMEKMMNPPDPLDLLTKLMALQGQLNPQSAANPLIERIMGTAVDNLLKPVPTGPVTSATAELVRQLPSVASYAAQAIHEWRMGSEAQRDTAAYMAGQKPATAPVAQPGRPAQPAMPSATILPPVAPSNGQQPVQNSEGQTVGAPSFEFIESRIVNIMADSATVDEAAERTVDYLADTDANVLPQLTALGEQGLMQFFCSQPVLKPATTNLPKLQEFLRAFLKYAGEVVTDGAIGVSPKAPPVN